MQQNQWVYQLFQSIDAKSTARFLTFLDEDCSFRLGNLPVVTGLASIGVFVGEFFDSIDSLKHELTEIWSIPNGIICHGTVSYTRHDGSVLTIPFSTIFKTGNSKIHEYLIFADTSQLDTK